MKAIEKTEKVAAEPDQSRREALKEFGRYAAVASTAMLLLDSQSPAAAYNPGNNKPVGGAGESPNGSDFGSGDKGMSQ